MTAETPDADGRAVLAVLTDEIQAALALWATRDDSIAQPAVTAAGYRAVDLVDALVRGLHAVRARLVGELRASEDAAMARSAVLLDRPRAERETGAGRGCAACQVVGPLLTGSGTSGRTWVCECGTEWPAAPAAGSDEKFTTR